MNRRTWNSSRALVFARGLYHIAACDGLEPREEAAITAFCEQVGILDHRLLDAEPFDYAEAAQVLDSPWLRRTMIRAARMMVQLDGTVSTAERDALRSMASALGVPERVALADLEGTTDPDDLVRWIAELAIDHVAWDDIAQNAYFWAFPHPTHPLQADAELIVDRSQALVCRVGDEICDVLGPGDHRAQPTVLPGLAQRRRWTNGPVEADLVFLRTGPSKRMRWGTANPIATQLQGYGTVQLRVYGRFATRFGNPRAVCERFLRQGIPSDDAVEQRLRRIVAGRFGQVLRAMDGLTVDHLNDLDHLCARARKAMDPLLNASGLHLARFEIENLTGPLELGLRPLSKRTQNLANVVRSVVDTRPEDTPTQELVPCAHCDAQIPAGARFCSHCGNANRRDCARCGASLPLQARFCSSCGAPQ